MDNPTHTLLQQLFQRLTELRRQLLEQYQAEALHQLRVCLRRLRSWLKDHPGSGASQLDRAIAQLVKPSNPARDWDTLAIRAQQILPAQHWRNFQQQLEPTLNHYHQQAVAPLAGDDWLQLERFWNSLKQTQVANEADPHDKSLAKARQRFIKASCRVLSQPSDHRWHRLRIRTKNLRYQLEGIENPSAAQQQWIAQLKQLQQQLGDWHDALVHQQLLNQLQDQGSVGRQQELIKPLLQHCDQQALSQLAQARQQLQRLNAF